MTTDERCKLLHSLEGADLTYIRVLFITLYGQTENNTINEFLGWYRQMAYLLSKSGSVWVDTARLLRVEELNEVA